MEGLANARASVSTTVNAATPQATRSIAYTVESGKRLDVYSPSEPGPWPVVIVVHGWGERKSGLAALAIAIASEGAVVYNVDVTMDVPFLAAIEQVACSVRFARDTAADYGGDPTRITLVGFSAGAATGATVAVAGDDYAEDCVVTDGSALPNAFVGYEGPYDWATQDYQRINLVPLREEDPDLWKAINPYPHIGGNPDLVVRLVHGDDADVAWYEVPRAVSVEFNQVLLEAGYDAELTLLEGASHGALHSPGSEAVDVTVEQVMQAARG